MIKMLRVDDNLLHGQVAFSWVRNMKIHTIIIADDKVVNDQFMKMSLGLAKPMGVNLFIEKVDDAIDFLQKEDKLNVMVIVNDFKNAVRLCEKLNIRYVNVGLIRKSSGYCVHYESMYLQRADIDYISTLLKKGIDVEYRLHYDDVPIQIKDILNDIRLNDDKRV